MTTRKELESVIATVINQHRLDGFTSRELAFAIRDKVEPMIRADERELVLDIADLDRAVLDGFRAKVEALPTENRYTEGPRFINRDDVLALLGGSGA